MSVSTFVIVCLSVAFQWTSEPSKGFPAFKSIRVGSSILVTPNRIGLRKWMEECFNWITEDFMSADCRFRRLTAALLS